MQAVARYEPEMKAEGRVVAGLGGLHIIGTERHESRRIDNQLRGRSGRQGDPGSSRFFLSLEDDLMRKFAGEWVSAVLTRLGMQEGEAIESKMVSRRIEGAQKKVEERNFDIRKNLLEYDEVMDEQRKRVYTFRQSLLEDAPPKDITPRNDRQPDSGRRKSLPGQPITGRPASPNGPASALGSSSPPRDIKGASFEDAEEIARTKGERQLRETIRQAMEENLPTDADPSEWTWQALANWANTRFELNLKEKDLRKFAQTDDEELESGNGSSARTGRRRRVPLRESRRLDSESRPDAGPRVPAPRLGPASLAGWAHHKFGLAIDPATWVELDRSPDRRPAQNARPAESTPSRKPSCQFGSP